MLKWSDNRFFIIIINKKSKKENSGMPKEYLLEDFTFCIRSQADASIIIIGSIIVFLFPERIFK